MRFRINRLLIWPSDTASDMRVITFQPKKVNVVSGWSGTGKSAVIGIIDYVLGSGKCSIPVGEIRDFASWYGLDVQTPNERLLIARCKPEARKVSDDVHLSILDESAELPSVPVKNASTELLKDKLNELAGLSDLRLTPHSDAGWNQRASFRDMVSFCLLPQHIVASPNTLFYKADSSDHRAKLQNVVVSVNW